MKSIAIIGASYLQEPLIQKAKSRGIRTHVFAWECGDPGEKSADIFYPISIVEKEKILTVCEQTGIDGICSISSDLASVTVNYVADKLGLICNSPDCVLHTTNKYMMRRRFEECGDPSPRFARVSSVDDIDTIDLDFPLIVKPVDRSGSRGVTKVYDRDHLIEAIDDALSVGFEKNVIIEEFVTGSEYSVEYISWEGEHHFLALTQKYTTGSPNFIETGHLEPAPVDEALLGRIKGIVEHALDSLQIRYGASHSEVMVSDAGDIRLIEIGGRMGGDNIGSSLVELSTGYDFLGGVIDVSLGIPPAVTLKKKSFAGIRFICGKEDLKVLEMIKKEDPGILVEENVRERMFEKVTDSSTRSGFFTIASGDLKDIQRYMPNADGKI
ncbi:MAG: ATP-grasp domain-containing protein [Lachnospiraceae bacterium]|nr:ATP-grasp domain-containing protein [Lachnospiraceae bacterium]